MAHLINHDCACGHSASAHVIGDDDRIHCTRCEEKGLPDTADSRGWDVERLS